MPSRGLHCPGVRKDSAFRAKQRPDSTISESPTHEYVFIPVRYCKASVEVGVPLFALVLFPYE